MTANEFVINYLIQTEKIERTCRIVASARWKAYKANPLWGTIPDALVNVQSTVGSFVSYIEPTTIELNSAEPELQESNYIYIQTTNGTEFSRHTFPIRYLLLSGPEIFAEEEQKYRAYERHAKTIFDKEMAEKEVKNKELMKKLVADKEKKEVEEYKRLRAKFEGDEYGH